jgi:hypothetical protein
VGTSAYTGGGIGFEIEGTGSFGPQIRATAKGSDEFSPYQIFRKSRGTSIVNNNDFLSFNQSEGFDGTNFLPAAAIICQVDGTPGTNDMPGRLVFSTTADGAASPTERLRITSAGNVGIGTTAPLDQLSVAGGGFSFAETGGAARNISWKNSTDNVGSVFIRGDAANGTLAFNTNTVANAGTERARIDSSGRLLVGTSSALGSVGAGAGSLLQIANGNQVIGQYSANLNGGFLELTKSRNATAGSHTVVESGDQLGIIRFSGSDGSSFVAGAQILCSVDGTPGANDMPGRLVFSTTADGAASPTERLRITNAGVLQVADAGNITVGTTTGTKIGTATTQKIGFYNATPVVQPTAVADATDAATVITQLNALLTRMRNLGLIAT